MGLIFGEVDLSASTIAKLKDADASTAANTAVSVGTTATLIAAAKTTRRSLFAGPTDGDIFIGYTNTVTTGNGVPIASGESANWDLLDRYTGPVWAIAASGTVNVRVSEVG